MFTLLLLAAISFHTDFEGGNLGKVERVGAGHYRCHVVGETDQDKRNSQASWYYVRIDGARGQALTLDMVDLPGEYNYKPNKGSIVGDTLPFWSDDEKTWRQVTTASYDEKTPLLRVRITPRSDRIWLAHTPPYTNRHLARLLEEVRRSPHARVEVVGKTVKQRDMPLVTITDASAPDKDKRVVWILFRQHAWESGSSWAGEGGIRFLLSDAAEAQLIRRETIFKIFPMCDPDGVARGGVRFNAHGYDLNRNWDAVDPVKMPEIAAQRKAILDWVDSGRRADILLTLHNDEHPEYLAGPPGEEHRGVMERLEKALAASPVFQATRKAELSPASTTINQPGRMAFYQGLYKERKLPAFLIELMCVRHPKLGRQPNIEDRLRFGRDLVGAMAAAVR